MIVVCLLLMHNASKYFCHYIVAKPVPGEIVLKGMNERSLQVFQIVLFLEYSSRSWGGRYRVCVVLSPKTCLSQVPAFISSVTFRHVWGYVAAILSSDSGIYRRVKRDPAFVSKWQISGETEKSYWTWWSSRRITAALNATRPVSQSQLIGHHVCVVNLNLQVRFKHFWSVFLSETQLNFIGVKFSRLAFLSVG